MPFRVARIALTAVPSKSSPVAASVVATGSTAGAPVALTTMLKGVAVVSLLAMFSVAVFRPAVVTLACTVKVVLSSGATVSAG